MEAMFDHYAESHPGRAPDRRRGGACSDGRVRIATSSSRRPTLAEVAVGSYPSFRPEGPEVEIVLKSADAEALAEEVAWLRPGARAGLRTRCRRLGLPRRRQGAR